MPSYGACDTTFTLFASPSPVLHEGERWELRDCALRVGFLLHAGLLHQRKLLILEADGDLRMFMHPPEEEDGAVGALLSWHEVQTRIRSGRLRSTDFEDAKEKNLQEHLTVLHPAVPSPCRRKCGSRWCPRS